MRADTLRAAVLNNAESKSNERHTYRGIGRRFAGHGSVNHAAEEWARGETHVNSAERYFSIFKLSGVYQHCDERHLPRYLAEFDFRYSNRIKLGVDDTERTRRAIAGAEGKRLTYWPTRSQAAAEEIPF